MSDISVSNVLSQIRQLRTQAEAMKPTAPAAAAAGALAAPGAGAAARPGGFAEALKSAVQQVNAAQGESSRMAQAFELGDPRADVASVMLAMQKSSVSFRALVEVRNRMVQAYQDVMNMPL